MLHPVPGISGQAQATVLCLRFLELIQSHSLLSFSTEKAGKMDGNWMVLPNPLEICWEIGCQPLEIGWKAGNLTPVKMMKHGDLTIKY